MSKEGTPVQESGIQIAVVGMAGRFPGAENIQEYWRNLRDGVESIQRLTDEQLVAAGVDPELIANPNYVRASGALQEVDMWDAGFFGFNPKEAAIMDPQHRLMLECAWEALEDAGHPPERFTGSIGVFAGCGMQSYFTKHLSPNRDLIESQGMFLVRHTGNDKDFLSTRVSYCFNLRGPSMSVQTACSTSLVAIHVAAQSLVAGECDLALAGGVSIEIPHGAGYLYKDGEVASPDGHCRAFDEQGQGTLFGSGAGVVALRRLEDALEDGDHIYAVIRSSAVNNDGSNKVGYLAPSVEGQTRAAVEALAVADIDPRSITYLEAHGTGTPVGDPIELTALSQAYESAGKPQWCAIASVKTNFGHLDTAAGVASFAKAALSLENEAIPPSLHFSRPNPAIDFANSPFFVNTALRPWKRGSEPRRAAVNSLGVGGTNAHLILEEAPAPEPSDPSRERQLFVLSARSPDALSAAAENIAQYLQDNPGANLADVAFTLREGRHAFNERRAIVARNSAEAIGTLRDTDKNSRVVSGRSSDSQPTVAFMFAGGGAQRPGMARDLYDSEEVFRSTVDEAVALLEGDVRPAVRELLLTPVSREGENPNAERPSIALPALFITQYALARQLESWGVEPSAMIGHSLGEYAAAQLAGVFQLGDALKLVTLRGRLFERVERGGMLSVQTSTENLRSIIPASLSIAAVNAPELSVASGPVGELARLEKVLESRDISFTRIRIDVAAHSLMLEPILADFRTYLRSIRMSAPSRPFISNLTGTWIDPSKATDPEYWVQHLRNTVLFSQGVGVLLEDKNRILLEVGPGRTLATLARAHPDSNGRAVGTSMRSHDDVTLDDASAAILSLGFLWSSGFNIDWQRLRGNERRQRISLPTYPFERQRYWIDAPRQIASTGSASAGAGNDKRLAIDDWFFVPEWERLRRPSTDIAGDTGTLILLDNGSAMGSLLLPRLKSHFGRVVVVRSGDGYSSAGDSFVVDPRSPRDFEKLFSDVHASGPVASHIVDLWTAEAVAPATAPNSADQELLAFYSLAHLAQGWGSWAQGKPTRLTFLTNNLFSVGAEQPGSAWKSLALGPVRVIPAEFPELDTRAVDFSSQDVTGPQKDAVADQIFAELVATGRPREVSVRRGECWRQEHNAMPLAASSVATAGLREKGVYLLTGGVGGIGLMVAEELARRCKARLVLVSRRVPSLATGTGISSRDDEILKAVARIQSHGAEIHLVAADVAAPGDADRAVAEAVSRFGTINGVFHAAGVLNDGLLQLRTDEESAAVLAPKVRGTLALNAAVEKYDLDCFVLFSSISAIAGLPGQTDYAAANAFMDAFAIERRERKRDNTIAIEWSTWRDLGMTAAPQEEKEPIAEHPFLGKVVQFSPEQLVFETTLRTSNDWLVGEHRLRNGTALVPGTGYLEIASAAATARVGGKTASAVELSDVAFLSPLVVPDNSERNFRIALQHNGERSSFVIAAEDDASWFQMATGKIAVARRSVNGAEPLAAVLSRCTEQPRRHFTTTNHPHLNLGPRWDVVEEVLYGQKEAVGRLSLPPELRSDTSDYRLHPGLLDMATACALELVPNYNLDEDFYVPLGYARLTSYAPLTAEMFTHIKLAESELDPKEVCVFDIVLYSGEGQVLAEIEGYMMTRVVDVNAMITANQRKRPFRLSTPRSGARAPRKLQPILADSITGSEGMDALMRTVGSRVPANVVVSWVPVDAMIAGLQVPIAATTAAGAAAAQVLTGANDQALADLEKILLEHPAIQSCAAMIRKDRTGTERTVCYVVFRKAEHATVSDLRRFVKGKLGGSRRPPSNFIPLEELPVSAGGGTVDYNALPDPFGVADTFVAARNPTETAIADAWVEALGVSRVSIHDNFFDIGGHSLLAVRVVTKLDKLLGVRLSQAIMVLQTLEQIAAECDRQRAAK